MKIDFSQALKNLDGTEMIAEGKAVQLSTVCANALVTPAQNETISGVDKIKRYELAKKIYCGGEVDLSVEELSLIKQSADKHYSHPVVYSEICRLIETN